MSDDWKLTNEQAVRRELAEVRDERDTLVAAADNLAIELAQVKLYTVTFADYSAACERAESAVAERDTALRERNDALESLRAIASLQVPAEASMAQHQACSIARAFLSSMREKADTDA